MNIAIIGGGAAGFFAAINLVKLGAVASITIYEAGVEVLSKVEASGGGRCNLSNSFEGVKSPSSVYPRGSGLIKRAFKVFDYSDTFNWFTEHGVELVTQEDGCVFPRSQSSMEIVDLFMGLCIELGIKIKMQHRVSSVEKNAEGFRLSFKNVELDSVCCDAVVVTTGGSPRREGLAMLEGLPLGIVDPVPSLFSFNIVDDPIVELMGAVAENVSVGFQGTKFKASGALLITHWGVSGPAILRLSSYAARYLSERDYRARLSVNWINVGVEQSVRSELESIIKFNAQKLVSSIRPYDLPSRLWVSLLKKAAVSEQRRWAELGSKGINRLVNVLTNDEYEVQGKGSFKDEFVTCGGVGLDSVNLTTLEARECENLYFAGEVLDVDAVTGGFNLQAAWSTGYVVADSLEKALRSAVTVKNL